MTDWLINLDQDEIRYVLHNNAEPIQSQERTVEMPGQRREPAGAGHVGRPKKAWDCGCGEHLEAGSEEALIAKVLYHLEVHHVEAHFTLEEAQELVVVEAYELP